MLIKTRGIVFRTIKYSETSLIADIYTEEKGLRSYIISGVRSSKPKVGSGLLQVMTILDLVAYFREDKDLNRLKEVKLHRAYQSIPYDVRKGAVGIFMIDIARKTIRGQETSPELFGFLFDYFTTLDEASHFSNVHLHFMVNLTAFLGFQMGGNYSAQTPFFDLQEGIFTEYAPPHPFWMKPEFAEKLNGFIETELNSCHDIILTRMERKAILNNLLDYFKLHIEHFPEVLSHHVLEEVLS